jgi:hypothetical protein
MEIDQLIKSCKRISGVSFLLGTLLLITFFFSNSYTVAMAGIPIICALALGNMVFLWRLIKMTVRERSKRRELIKTGTIMVSNIPVALLYFYLVLVLFDVVIVRFKNGINEPIEQVRIIGCDERNIGQLRPRQAKIEWIELQEGCLEKSIAIEYELKGKRIKEIVYRYVVDGRRINYTIRGNPKTMARE